MKKNNKNKIDCLIKNLWASVEEMNKDLFIDLEKQEIFKVSSGEKCKFFSSGSKKNDSIYYVINFNGTKLKVHRLFFYYHHGYLPPLVDHKDRNSQNNNIENLRELTKSENGRNTDKRSGLTSRHKGVFWSIKRKKWETRITLNGKGKFLGYYENEDYAGQVVNDAIRKYGLEEVSVMNDTPQERARKLSLFDNLEPITDLK
jgi:hypothetical protein